MIKNFWGHEIPTPQEVLCNEGLAARVLPMLQRILHIICANAGVADEFLALAVREAKKEPEARQFEAILRTNLAGKVSKEMLRLQNAERARLVSNEIKPYLTGGSLLDVGCGNGLIAQEAKPLFNEIVLLDVVNYLDPNVRLPFLNYCEGSAFPIDRPYDTVLLLTVLHHSSDPLRLLQEAWKATRRRLVIIESVFGIHSIPPNASYGYEMSDSSESEQIGYATIIDWFYNRVLHDVPTPFNFTTPERWNAVFANDGMRVLKIELFGQDIAVGPEFHILYVLTKEA